MDQKKIDDILKKHKKWVLDEDGGERADLSYANLRNANLRNADLSYADLSYANLSDANLRNANLRNANLSDANLSYADLSYANLRNADNLDRALMYNLQCPEEGSFIGWKKCRDNIIVKLKITDDSKRSSATSRKCRASKVEVLEIIGADKAESKHESGFIYEVGSTIEISDFNGNRWDECSTGIHFFITRKEAENY